MEVRQKIHFLKLLINLLNLLGEAVSEEADALHSYILICPTGNPCPSGTIISPDHRQLNFYNLKRNTDNYHQKMSNHYWGDKWLPRFVPCAPGHDSFSEDLEAAISRKKFEIKIGNDSHCSSLIDYDHSSKVLESGNKRRKTLSPWRYKRKKQGNKVRKNEGAQGDCKHKWVDQEFDGVTGDVPTEVNASSNIVHQAHYAELGSKTVVRVDKKDKWRFLNQIYTKPWQVNGETLTTKRRRLGNMGRKSIGAEEDHMHKSRQTRQVDDIADAAMVSNRSLSIPFTLPAHVNKGGAAQIQKPLKEKSRIFTKSLHVSLWLASRTGLFIFICSVVWALRLATRNQQSQDNSSANEQNQTDMMISISSSTLLSLRGLYLFGAISSTVGLMIFLIHRVYNK